MKLIVFIFTRLFGDLQAREISNHLRLYEFRAFFDRVNVIGPYELKSLFVEFPEFQKCHQAFNAAQGQVVSFINFNY